MTFPLGMDAHSAMTRARNEDICCGLEAMARARFVNFILSRFACPASDGVALPRACFFVTLEPPDVAGVRARRAMRRRAVQQWVGKHPVEVRGPPDF
eukprot:scaffold7581_cov258-Pinguiococcus_pyrenoidosus.AAC.3